MQKSNMNNIPKKLRADMAADPFYKRCVISGQTGTRWDPIEWHHNLIYAGRQVQRKFAILPVKRSLHLQANDKQLRAQLDWIMWNRASEDEVIEFSKAKNYGMYRMALNCMFGRWSTTPAALEEINMTTVPQVFLPYAIMKDGRTLSEHVATNPKFLLGDGN